MLLCPYTRTLPSPSTDHLEEPRATAAPTTVPGWPVPGWPSQRGYQSVHDHSEAASHSCRDPFRGTGPPLTRQREPSPSRGESRVQCRPFRRPGILAASARPGRAWSQRAAAWPQPRSPTPGHGLVCCLCVIQATLFHSPGGRGMRSHDVLTVRGTRPSVRHGPGSPTGPTRSPRTAGCSDGGYIVSSSERPQTPWSPWNGPPVVYSRHGSALPAPHRVA